VALPVAVRGGAAARLLPGRGRGAAGWWRWAAAVVALFVLVTVLRWQYDRAGEAVALLSLVPIVLGAGRFGRRGGITTAGAAMTAFVVLAAVDGRGDLDLTGWAGPLLAMAIVGGLVGHLVSLAALRDVLGTVQADERRRLERVCDAQHQALVAGDGVVQGVAAACWLLEEGRSEEAKALLGAAVADGVASLSRGLAAERDLGVR
jgi:hypothetical protein